MGEEGASEGLEHADGGHALVIPLQQLHPRRELAGLLPESLQVVFLGSRQRRGVRSAAGLSASASAHPSEDRGIRGS